MASEETLLLTLLTVTEKSAAATVARHKKTMEQVLGSLHTRYADDRDLADSIITLTSEYHAVRDRAVRYEEDVREFTELARRRYVPDFKEAQSSGSTKVAKHMLADMSAHFEQVVQSFSRVASECAGAEECVQRPDPASETAVQASETGGALLKGAGAGSATAGVLFATGCIESIGVSAFVAGGAVVGAGAAVAIGALYKLKTARDQARQEGFSECFKAAVQKVKAAVSKHTGDLLAIRSSLRAIAADDAGKPPCLADIDAELQQKVEQLEEAKVELAGGEINNSELDSSDYELLEKLGSA